MLYEVIRWISLVILWVCIGFQIWSIRRSSRTLKEWKRAIECTEQIRKKYLERLAVLEEVPDEG